MPESNGTRERILRIAEIIIEELKRDRSQPAGSGLFSPSADDQSLCDRDSGGA